MGRSFDYQALIGENNPLLRYPALQEAALDEFARKKFEDASLNDILKKSGMSKGSFYHNFGDKFGLYLAMIDIIAKKKAGYFQQRLRETVAGSNDFFAALKEIIKATTAFMLADERQHLLFNRIMEETDDFRSRLYSFFPYDYIGAFHQQIVLAVDAGQIDSRYPPELVVKLLQVVFSNLHKLVPCGEPTEVLHTVNQIVDIIQYGVRAKDT